MLQRCKDANLILNWEKCHFVVKEGIVLGHKVSGAGLEVDKAKVIKIRPEKLWRLLKDSFVAATFLYAPGSSLEDISSSKFPKYKCLYSLKDKLEEKKGLKLKMPRNDEPMWAADRVVAPTPGCAITIPETANEFAIKDTKKEAVRLMMFSLSHTGEAKTWLDELNEGTFKTWDELHTAFISRFFLLALFDRLLEEIRAFSQHGNETLTEAWLRSSNSDTDKIMARMNAMTMKMDAQYKEFQSRSKQPNPDHNDDDKPMSPEEEAKFMQTFRRTRFYNDYRDRDSNRDNWLSSRRNDLKIKLETTTKNHQASIQNIEAKFDRLVDKQSGRPSGSLPSNTQPNPKGSSSKPYQHPQARNDHDEDEESTPQPKSQTLKPVKETPIPKPYKPKIPYPQRLRKEKMEAQYGKFLDMIRAVRINVPLVVVLAGMPNYENFLKELISNKYKLEQISSTFLSDESFAMIQIKVPPKLGDPESFLIPCNFSKSFSCNALVDLGASINLMPYSLYAKLSLETLKPTKMSIRLADRSFQHPIGIAENMLVEVGKFTFPVDFVILEEKLFAEFDEFMAMTADENSESESNTEEPSFEKITFNTDYKIKTSLEEPPLDLELKPLPDNLEYVFLEKPSFLRIIISSQLSQQNKNKLIFVLKRHKQAFTWKTTDIPGICPSFCKHKIQLLDDKNPVV
ncbi:reverse transcriptase domain-containing protein [Tanacetum coccineum]